MTTTAKIDPNNPDGEIISRAAEVIRMGGLVAFPTETVYGLGADALKAEAVRSIYAAKGRPSDNPLILHVASIEQAEGLVFMNDTARRLARRFWPGPLTFVLPAKPCVPSVTRGGLDTAAVRMPDNPTALALIREAKTPIAAPSANTSGRPSPTDAGSVLADMDGRIAMILDGGRVRVGIESTVIDLTNPEHPLLLRPGGMSVKTLEHALGTTLGVPDALSAKRSPGTRYRHYSPSIPVKIWHFGESFPECEHSSAGYLGFHEPPFFVKHALLFGDNADYSHELFAAFRAFKAEGCSCIITEWPEDDTGISAGLRDRILRSAGD